jgi:hypothetical protein
MIRRREITLRRKRADVTFISIMDHIQQYPLENSEIRRLDRF